MFMKYSLLSICLVLLFSTTQGQQNSKFYYYGNNKVYVKQSTEKLYVRIKEDVAEAKKKELQNKFKLPAEAIMDVQAANFVVIDLKTLNENERAKIISDLSKSNEIEISRPVFIASGGNETVVDEDFYVKLKQGISYQQLRDFAAQKNCILNEKPYKYDNTVYFLKAGAVNKFDGLQLANDFYESGLFEYSEPDFRLLNGFESAPKETIFKNGLIEPAKPDFKILGEQAASPNDALFDYQWALKNTGSAIQYNGTVGADINVLGAWDVTMGSPLIKIAVIDGGIDRAQPDLVNNITAIGFGLVASNATTGDILSSSQSHGTSCAGIIAAEANNSIGVTGVAPNCKLIPVNVHVNTNGSYGASSQITVAIDWAWDDGGADVLSNSWGGGEASSLMDGAIHRAITQGRNGKGSVVIFASGNDNNGVALPAINTDVIAVGAMSMCYERKSTSSCDGEYWGGNYGTGLDISAPGVKIATTTNTGTGVAPNTNYNLTFNGTSSATPIVSGVAALVLSANSNLTQLQVREILERTARKVGPYNYSFVENQPNGSWSYELGHHKVRHFAM